MDVLKDAKQPIELRTALARSLRQLGETGTAVIPVCGELLREPTLSDDLAGALLYTLGAIGPDSVPVLVREVKEGSTARRAAAISYLGELGAVAAPALPALEMVSKEADENMRDRAERSIFLIKANRAAVRAALN